MDLVEKAHLMVKSVELMAKAVELAVEQAAQAAGLQALVDLLEFLPTHRVAVRKAHLG